MPKKIYDILPPKMAHKVEDAAKAVGLETKKKKRTVTKAPKHKKDKRFPWREIILGAIVIVALLSIYLYNKLPKVDIQIYPKTETLNLEEKVAASTSASQVDMDKKIIPARYLEQQSDGAQDFPATGISSNQGKATGTVTVYNKVSPSTPLTLKAGTHFLSDGGKYFVSLDKIIVPAMKGNTAGSISVNVQAEDFGTDYNIGASKFSIPKLSGTAYYYSVWAESKSAMSGGYTGSVKKVTQDDLSQAKDTLTNSLFAKAQDLLKKKLSADEVLLDSAMSKTIIGNTDGAKDGTIADTFHESASVKISALVFKKQDLEKFVESDIASNISSSDGQASKNYLPESVKINYAIDSVDMQSGIENLDVQLSAAVYRAIDKNSLVDALSLKSADQIQSVVGQMYGDAITKTQINFWPFWVHQAPSDKNRIIINLKFK